MLLRELLYAFIPYSINKSLVKRKCGFHKQGDALKNGRLVVYPPSLDLKKVVTNEIDKSIAFLPYCAKPIGEHKCPLLNTDSGRKDQKCIKLTNGQCNVPCSLGQMIDVLKKYGFTRDRIFIIDKDSNLFPWLKQKRKEGYKYFLPGVGCHYGVGYALDYVEKELGYKGCIAFLEDYDPLDRKNGVCKSPSDYLSMEKTDKGKKTKITDESIQLLDQILSGSIFETEVNSAN